MAKRIEFIAPVEAIRGNMSGRQDLVYAENDNKAFEAPQGTVNYARNYTPRFVGAKRASDGRKYFQVRTKNGVNLTAKSMQAMALLGGTGAIYAAIVNNDTLRNGVELVYRFLRDRTPSQGGLREGTTFRQYVSGIVRLSLASKVATITFAGGAGVQRVEINNPWVSGGTGTDVSIAQSVLVRFWRQLAVGGIFFYVDSQTGIATVGMTLDQLVANNELNFFGIGFEAVTGEAYAWIPDAGLYLLNNSGEYVKGTFVITSDYKFTTTKQAPKA